AGYGGAVVRAVVDHHEVEMRVVLRKDRVDAAHHPLAPVLDGDDDRHRGRLLGHAELVAHLARRELAAMHRTTVLGLLWPLIRIGAQLAVLVLVFHTVLRLGIRDFPAFALCGLAAWTWFSTGVAGAAGSVVGHRDLVFQPRFPIAVIPLVALVVPLVDLLIALPLVFGF